MEKAIWMQNLDDDVKQYGDYHLHCKIKAIKECIKTTKSPESKEGYQRQLDYALQMQKTRQEIKINFDRITTWHEGDEG